MKGSSGMVGVDHVQDNSSFLFLEEASIPAMKEAGQEHSYL
jgi:hypothetical protein